MRSDGGQNQPRQEDTRRVSVMLVEEQLHRLMKGQDTLATALPAAGPLMVDHQHLPIVDDLPTKLAHPKSPVQILAVHEERFIE